MLGNRGFRFLWVIGTFYSLTCRPGVFSLGAIEVIEQGMCDDGKGCITYYSSTGCNADDPTSCDNCYVEHKLCCNIQPYTMATSKGLSCALAPAAEVQRPRPRAAFVDPDYVSFETLFLGK